MSKLSPTLTLSQLVGQEPIQETKGLSKEVKDKIYNQRIREKRRKLINYMKAGPCFDCGKCFPPECMDFDHVRGEKVGDVGQLFIAVSIEALIDEIEKCDLVCANCHRIRTKKRYNNESN